MRSRLFGALALLLLISLPVSAADRVIQNGSDLWYTAGDGRTYIDFSKTPIPAGFFCFKSAPFTQKVVFRGVPIVTGEPKALGATDTIVQRLDDAAFDRRGIAMTRIQVRALHFESVEPIKTACGEYRAEVRLNGEQPVTRMRIVREKANGGRFFAPIAVNGKVVFTPIGRPSSEILEINRNVRFPANQGVRWADRFGKDAVQRNGFVHVDTDNDRVPDTYLPGTTSNFAPGWTTKGEPTGGRGGQTKVADQQFQDCHVDPSEGHCPGGVIIYY